MNSSAILAYNKALEFSQKGNDKKAIAYYLKAIRLSSSFPEANNNLGNLYFKLGEYASAIKHLKVAHNLLANDLSVKLNLAKALLNNGQITPGVNHLREIISVNHEFIPARLELARYYSGIGLFDDFFATLNFSHNKTFLINAFIWTKIANVDDPSLSNKKIEYKQLVYDYILDCEKQGGNGSLKLIKDLQIDGFNHCLICELINTLIDAFKKFHNFIFYLIKESLDNPFCYVCMQRIAGKFFKETGQYDKAIKTLKIYLKSNPADVKARCYLVDSLYWSGDLISARKEFKSLPKNRTTHPYFYITELFYSHKFSQGWDILLGSLRIGHRSFQNVRPAIDSHQIKDKSVLIFRDQGIGDEIQFLSCIKSLMEMKPAKIVIEVEQRLQKIVTRSFPDVKEVFGWTLDIGDDFSFSKDSTFDYAFSLRELAKFTRQSISDFNTGAPYLKADPGLKEKWASKLDQLSDRPKVGIAWKGGGTADAIRSKSVSLKMIADLFSGFNVDLINLQYGEVSDEIKKYNSESDLKIINFNDINPIIELENQFALIANLDLVVQVSNTSAHIAGSLGVKCALITGHPPDYRWFPNDINKSQSPWYGSLRLFNRDDTGSLSNVIYDLKKYLNHEIAQLR